MKSMLLFLLLILTFNLGFAQFGREEIKKSKTIKDEITIGIKTENDISLFLDLENQTEKTLKEKDYFQVKSDEFRVYAKFVNPLRYVIRTSQKSLDEELFIASRDFINSAAEFIQDVQTTKAGGARSKPVVNAPTNATLEPQLVEMYLVVIAQYSNFFVANSEYWKSIGSIDLAETSKTLADNSDKTFNALLAIKNVHHIENVIASNAKVFENNKNLIIELKQRLLNAENEFNKIQFTNAQKYVKAFIQNKMQEMKSEITDLEKRSNDIEVKYKKIEELFSSISKKKHSLTENNKFELEKILDINKQKRHEITVIVEKILFNAKEKTIEIDSSKSYQINVRKKTTFIPVLSSGVIYTNLSFPQFGTDTNELGETIVVQTEDEENEIAIATYLNLYVNNKWDLPAFLQFGIGPSREKPLFFLGGGAELMPQITFSVGGVFTWFPELNELNIGDLVSGTAAIEDDISFDFNFKPKLYFGLNIDITKK